MFKKYKWSNWYDINTGVIGSYFYLLQARRRADGKLKFRVESSEHCPTHKKIELSDLKI
jgi:hypothetical protein